MSEDYPVTTTGNIPLKYKMDRNKNLHRSKFDDWAEQHLEGAFVVTPKFIWFELESDMLLVGLGYLND